MRKFGLLAMLLLAGACKGTEPVGPPVTTSIQVTSSPTSISVNGTAQASAIVKDQNGDPLSGKTISWSSSNQAVATVTQAGVIKGISPGTAEIQGSVDGVTGKATVQVIAAAISCVGGATDVSMTPGEVRVLSASATKGCIKFTVTPSTSAYLVIAANTKSQSDVVDSYIMKSDIGDVVPSSNLLTNPFHAAAQLTVPLPELASGAQLAFETKLRAMERRELKLGAGRRAWADRLASTGRYSVNVAAIPVVGEQRTIKIPKSCSNFTTITATARHISARSIIYTDNAAPPGGFSDAEFQEIGKEFDDLIYPTDTEYFGTPYDLDANSRIIILYTPEVNKLTEANSPNGFVGGFFFAGDLFPATGGTGLVCPQSNVGELFYLLAPDPNGTVNGNKRTTADVRQGTRGTIAHEFQHMINASERLRSPVEQEFEEVWLDEALSHFAEDLNGRKLKGLNETGNYSFPTIRGSTPFADYFAFFYQNFARFMRYLQSPGSHAPTSFLADESLEARGAAWALVRYTADQYAPGGDVKAFINGLVHGAAITDGAIGVKNLTAHAGNVPFDTLIAGWMVANYADDFGIPGLASKYEYKTYDMRANVIPLTTNATYPLPVTEITTTGFSTTGSVRSGSGNYFWFSRSAGGPARSFRFLNPDGATAASFTGATFVILRTQ